MVLLVTSQCFARVPAPEGTEDLVELARPADVVFHASVIDIRPDVHRPTSDGYIARLHVNRVYKGQLPPELNLAYNWPGFMMGHGCIDLTRSTSWLIFGKIAAGSMVLFSHDCEGGLPVSSILAADAPGTWTERLQRDLIAGLDDNAPDVRLANIARLGGLKLRSSAVALHRVIEIGSETERKWAIYACLRSGDLSVLPAVEKLVIAIPDHAGPSIVPVPTEIDAAPQLVEPVLRGGFPHPDASIAWELQNLRSPNIVPMLIRVLRAARWANVRGEALLALEKIKDPRSAPAVDAALADPDPFIRFNALVTMRLLTNASQCHEPPPEAGDAALTMKAAECQRWWNENGESFMHDVTQ
jgi:hypothetical protein